jgi:hypothetical protein
MQTTRTSIPALSVMQPYAEQIMLGIKRFEYRSRGTNRRGRVYLYASKTRHVNVAEWDRLGDAEVKFGHVIGTVEIVDCDWSAADNCFRWHLRNPRRIPPKRPRNQPQPVWFYPFS